MHAASRVTVRDRFRAALSGFGNPARVYDAAEKSVVEVEGWVKICLRERGKIVPGSHRESHNTITNTGREYIAMSLAYQAVGTRWRYDEIAYIGVGTGAQTLDVGVTALVAPIAYSGSTFLAPLDLIPGTSPSFPLTSGDTVTRTTVEFHRLFAENEITTSSTPVNVSEFGLFTDGNQSTYAAGGRDTTLANALAQSPQFYWSIEPFQKTNALSLDASWEIRL
jgi:hypothetical protein